MARKPVRKTQRRMRPKQKKPTIAALQRQIKDLQSLNRGLYEENINMRALQHARYEALDEAVEHEKREQAARQPAVEAVMDAQAGWWWRRPWAAFWGFLNGRYYE